MDDQRRRNEMVENQLVNRGIVDPCVLSAMRRVPRHLFVPAEQQAWAYADGPLPIGSGQTISQPYMVAYMTQALGLKATDRVLEIGTGCGYQTAVLAQCCAEVVSIEIRKELLEAAQTRLAELGIHNVEFHWGNGLLGKPDKAPFDGILIAAASAEPPLTLMEQLAENRTMICPVGRLEQHLMGYSKKQGVLKSTYHFAVRFVPLVPHFPH